MRSSASSARRRKTAAFPSSPPTPTWRASSPQAKRLTEASTSEQAHAGLDALTDAERAEFTTLNDAYTSRFGFPFIIAVRDHTKASILAAFTRRLGNERDAEFAEACAQVERIAWHRLKALLP